MTSGTRSKKQREPQKAAKQEGEGSGADDVEQETPKPHRRPRSLPAALQREAKESDVKEEVVAPVTPKKTPQRRQQPRKRKAADQAAADSDNEPLEDLDDEAAPRKKRQQTSTTRRTRAPRKAAAKKVTAEDLGSADEIEYPRPVRRATRRDYPDDVRELDDGFTAVPPALLYKQFGEPVKSAKIAAFALDEVLIRPPSSRGGRVYYLDASDISLYNEKVVEKLTEYQNQGYKIVIFTYKGQIGGALTGPASDRYRGVIKSFMKMVPVPVLVLVTTDRAKNSEWRKPNTAVWQWFCDHILSEDGVTPDLDHSFFVGDTEDGVNAQFADNIGIKDYRTAVDEFGPPSEHAIIPPVEHQEHQILSEEQANCPNAELVELFYKLAQHNRESGDENGAWKARANTKVADMLSQLKFEITAEPKVIKKLAELPGVGKGSIARIKQYLSEGTFSDLEPIPANRIGKPLEDKARQQAEQFM